MLRRSSERMAWTLLTAGAAAGAALAARRGITAGWKLARKTDPPQNPAERGVEWQDALLWGAAIGLAGGLSRIVARRGAAAAWRRWRGPIPS